MNARLSPAHLDTACRRDFGMFTWKAYNLLHGDTFTPAWHAMAMCDALDEACFGQDRRLVISVPPRHLKSFTAAVALPAFVLGWDPAKKLMVATYSLDLRRDHALLCRRLMETAFYQNLFPNTRLSSCSSEHLRTDLGGDRHTVSVGGSVTGFGGDIIIIDDALKAADAPYPVARERVHAFLDGTLPTRASKPAERTIIAIQQRLHEDDPAGYLLAKGGYVHLELPAIATRQEVITLGNGRVHVREVGTPLFPQHFDLATLEQLRRSMWIGVEG